MLTAYPVSGHAEPLPAAHEVSWVDLLHPTDEEKASIEARYGFKLPSRLSLSEVEASSRVSEKNGVLFLSVPGVSHVRELDEPPSPVGFVLSKDVLVTLRFLQLRSFDAAASRYSSEDRPRSSVEAFAALVDEMVDVSADLLEGIGADLDAVSRAVFPKVRQERRNRKQTNEDLRDVLIDVGSAGERLSRIRDCLLGLQRIVQFVSGIERDWIPGTMQARLRTAQTDLSSLNDYETHLFGKVQFLLDATLGFINTQQNDIFRVLTIVSVVGIPPTLVASMYGMNFRNMPEYTWAWGYEYGLSLIVLSAVVPFLWFKWRKWV